MKHLILILLVFPILIFGQVHEGGIALFSQNEVDSFKINYGDIQEMTGNLFIGGVDEMLPSDIANLDSLHLLKNIRGFLRIQNTSFLENLNGLHNIDSIQGIDLWIENNTALTNISALQACYFPGLQSDYGEIRIVDNQNLTSIIGLENITKVGFQMRITDSPLLNSLTGLNNLEEACFFVLRDLGIANLEGLNSLIQLDDFFINQNEQLENLSGLENLQSVCNFWISNNTLLNSLQAIDNLTFYCDHGLASFDLKNNDNLSSIEEIDFTFSTTLKIDIQENENLQNVSQFKDLKEAQNITIKNNASLQSCRLDSLKNATSISFIDNPSLTDIGSLTVLDSLHSSLKIENNDALVEIPSFDNLNFASGISIKFNDNLQEIMGFGQIETSRGIGIFDNFSLERISGFNELVFLESGIGIWDNINLNSIVGFNNLEQIGTLAITGNYQLSQIPSFNNLLKVTNNISISGSSLPEISGFNALDSVQNRFWIRDNSALKKITAFEQLRHVDNELRIIDNPLLDSLTTFSNMGPHLRNLYVIGNDSLKMISGFSSVERLLDSLVIHDNPSLANPSGMCYIFTDGFIDDSRFGANPNPFNSRNGFVAFCDDLSDVDDVAEKAFEIYPNPFFNELVLESSTPFSSVNMYNSVGQVVFHQKTEVTNAALNLSGLTEGLYLLEIIDENNRQYIEKVIRQK